MKTLKKNISTSLFLTTLVMCSMLSVGSAFGSQIYAELEAAETLNTGETVMVHFTLVNMSNQDIQILKWNTPLEGIKGEIFSVERDGEMIDYQGIIMKRGLPLPEDYILIQAGGKVSAEVNIAEAYDFSSAGVYTIHYLSPKVTHIIPHGEAQARSFKELQPLEISSDEVSVRINNSIERTLPIGNVDDGAQMKQTNYVNCDAGEESIVSYADLTAALKAALVRSYFANLSVFARQTNKLYKTWFGAYTSSRYAEVLDNFEEIEDVFYNQTITYQCGGPSCTNSAYAYIYKSDGMNKVYLCPAFWTAPSTGYDTQWGTLIHELSHEVADTKDHVYGTTSCRNLAINDPDKAVENADSHEYASENYKVGAPKLVFVALILCMVLFSEGVRRFKTLPPRFPSG